jgi:NHLM bacteriocin system ABC transporter peptidase/ATP-binding protein
MEAIECGAASLAIIFAYYQHFIPLELLRVECGVSRDGSKAANLFKVARKHGFAAKAMNVELQDLTAIKMPAILFWGFNHFLVLEGIKKRRVYLNDPATGPRVATLRELNEKFTGIVLTFQPTAKLPKMAKTQTLIKAVKSRLIKFKELVSFIFLTALFMVIPGIIIPAFSKIFIDNVVVKDMHNWLFPLLMVMLFVALIYGILVWLQEIYLTKLNIKMNITQTSTFFYHLFRLPIEFFSRRFAGDLVYRANLNKNIADLFSGRLASSMINLIMLVFYIALMLVYDVTLTCIGIGSALIALIVLKLAYRKQVDANRLLQTESGKALGMLMRGLEVVETIKSSGSEADFFTQTSGQMAKLVNTQQVLGSSLTLLKSIYPFLTKLTLAMVLTIGAVRVIEGNMSVGTLVAFQALMMAFLLPLSKIIILFQDLQILQTDIEKIDDVLRYPQANFFTGIKNKTIQKPKLSGNVEIKNVAFGYSSLEAPLLSEISFNLTPGKRIALIGKTGSGKSTISKLVAGLFQPWEGQILFDGYSVAEIPQEIFANSIAVVNQEFFLFEGTMRDNIIMWDETITEEQMIQASKDAGIHDEIITKLGGYLSFVEEDGRNFSGGQRQMLEIARALANNPSILILDEATSALDAYTEQKIDNNLRRRGCACLIIAHRLSTIKDCDEIIVLENGKIVERGIHEQLLDKCTHYRELIELY